MRAKKAAIKDDNCSSKTSLNVSKAEKNPEDVEIHNEKTNKKSRSLYLYWKDPKYGSRTLGPKSLHHFSQYLRHSSKESPNGINANEDSRRFRIESNILW